VVRLEIQDAIVAQPVLREVFLHVIDHSIRAHRAHPVQLGRAVHARHLRAR
jgi:CRISPR/Cas system-associated exonuclease Cas4 (RecB family)